MWWNKAKNTSKPAGATRQQQTQAAATAAPRSLMRALEPRVMFDGALAGTAAVAADHSQADAHAAEVAKPQAVESALRDTSTASATSAGEARREIVFVDIRTPDVQTLLQSISASAEVVLLDTQRNGVEQIAQALAGRHDIDAIHIISHGDQGLLLLGNAPLFSGNLESYGAQLQAIGRALSSQGDILLYGCDVAAGSAGAAFVSRLAEITGADIAASSNDTGAEARGGDWTLEVATGDISQSHVLDAAVLASYDHLLVTSSVNTVAALKSAIATGNTDGVDDVITFTGNITFASAADAITINVTDGHTMQIVGAGFILDGANQARVLDVTTSGANSAVVIDNLTIRNGLIAGAGANKSVNAADSLGAGIRNNGVLTLTNTTITANKASGGGGGGGGSSGNYAGGGGGGGGFGTGVGGIGGLSAGALYGATLPSGIHGGNGAGGGANYGGRGGSNTGGAGGSFDGLGNNAPGYVAGGSGATANNGSISIGGGGGGVGAAAAGGRGGAAVGGIYNGASGFLTILNSSVTNNLGAGGGGGGGVSDYQAVNYGRTGNGGAGGAGVGALWNYGGTVRMDSTSFATLSTGNVGAGGIGGKAMTGGSNGANGSAFSTIRSVGGTLDTNYSPNMAPTIGNLNGDSVAWAGVGSTVVLDASANATLADAELGALNSGNGNWSGASLTVQRNSTAISTDVLGFNTSGALFTVSGSNLQSGGQTFATFTNTAGVLTITFTSSGTAATTALVNDIAHRITYRSDTPAGDATMRFSLSDGTSTTTADVTVASDTIYVTNSTDTGTIDRSNGVSFGEAVAIAAADGTGSQTIVFASSLAGTTMTLNAVTLGESLTFDMDPASGLTLAGGTLTLGGGTTQTFGNGTGDTATISSLLAGSGALTKAGAGTLTLSGSGNTYSGATTVSAGTLTVSGGDAIATASTVTVSSGATLALSSNETVGNLSGAGSITLGSNSLTTTLTGDTTFSGSISGTGGLTVNQAGAATYALTLSGTNTYTGATILANYGWLKLDGDASMSSSSAVRVNGNSVLTLLSDQTVGSLASNAGTARIQLGAFTLSAGGDNTSTTVSGVVSGTGSLVKQGIGTLTLAGTNTYTGTTTVSTGTLSISADANLGAGTVTLATGSTLDISGATTVDNAIQLGGDAAITNASAVTLSGLVSGSSELLKGGVGNLTLSNNGNSANTWSLNVAAGTATVTAATQLGTGPLTLSGGTLAVSASGSVTLSQAINVTGTSAIDIDGSNAGATVTLSGTRSGSGALTLNAADSNIFVSGGGTLSGALTLSSASTGLVALVGSAVFGTSQLTLTSNTTLGVAGDTRSIANDIVLLGNATLRSGAPSTGSGVITFSGVISGSNNLNLLAYTAGGGTAIALTGSNTYTGTTTLSSGKTQITSDANLGAGNLILAGGTLAINGATTIDNSVVVSSNATLEVNAAATLSGVVSGSSALTKTGTATLTLSATNTHTGSKTVSAGTFGVTGSMAGGSTTVASGATLAGTGTLGGNVTVQSGGTLAPGVSGAGTLTVNGDLTMPSGSTLAVDINGATAGTGYDRVVVNGTVDVSGATLAATHGYTPGLGDTYTIIVNDAADTITGTFSGLAEGAQLTAGGNGTQLTASYVGDSGNDFTLTAPANPAITDVSSPTANGTYKIGDTVAITVTLNAAVFVDTTGGTPALLLETGLTDRFANYVAGSGTSTLTFQYIVQAGDVSADLDFQGTSALVLNGGTIRDAGNLDAVLTLPSPGTAGSLGANKALVIDGVRPTASIVVANTALAIGQTSAVTLTFSEAVTGLTNADLTVQNGTLSTLSSIDGGVTWTATFTPSANIADTTNIITLDNTGVVDAAGNTGTGTTASNNYAIYTQRPTASIVVADPSLTVGETSAVTITFNEAVTGLTLADFTVANGTLTGLNSNDGGITWTATLTPTANVEDTTNLVTLDNTGVVDAAGNAGIGSTSSNNYAIDTLRPTASIVVASPALAIGQTSAVTITFSEAVTGFTSADLSVQNGTLSNLSSSDGGVTWTATLTPSANVEDTTNLVTLDNTGVADAAGNTGTGTTRSNNYAIDTLRPTASIVVADSALKAGQTSAVTITFSEAVTGFTAADLSVANGALAGLSSSDGGRTWTATLTPTANVEDTTNVITLDNTGVQDAAGNAGTGATSSGNYAIDTLPPGAAGVVRADASPTNAGSVRYTVTFSESVSGVDASDFSLTGTGSASGSITAVTRVDGHSFTVLVDQVAGSGSLRLDLQGSGTGITDSAGNALTGGLAGEVYAIDRVAPSVASVRLPAAGSYGIGDTLDFSLTFSEALQVNTSQGTPRLVIPLQNGGTAYADFVGRTGTDTLNFRYTVLPGQVARQGISISGYEARGAVVQDLTGNAMTATLPAVDGTGIVVNGAQPPVLAPAPAPAAPPVPLPLQPASDSVPVYTYDTDGSAALGTPSPASSLYTARLDTPAGLLTALPAAARGTGLLTGLDAPGLVNSPGGQGSPLLLGMTPGLLALPSSAPLQVSIPDLGLTVVGAGEPLHIVLPEGTFNRGDSSVPFTLSARLADGRPLPSWLRFDPESGTFTGQAPKDMRGELVIQVVARDARGNLVFTTLKIVAPEAKRQSSEAPAERGLDAPPLVAALAALGLPAERPAPPAGRPSLTAQFDQFGRAARQQEAAQLLHHLQRQAQPPVEPAEHA